MANLKRPLRPLYRARVQREKRTKSHRTAASQSGNRRKWGAPPRERAMLCLALSLALMVAIARLPIDSEHGDDARETMIFGSTLQPDEALAMITVHEVPTRDSRHPDRRESSAASTIVPPVEVEHISDATYAHAAAESSPNSSSAGLIRAVAMKPAADDAPLYAPSEKETRTLLRHAYGPPAVDEPPKVRVGSMLIRYPLSALKKAIEGLVIVRFVVETSGRASGIKVIKGLDDACDREVVEAIENARFLPGKRKGKEVPAYSQLTIRFVLDDAGSPMPY